MKSFIMYTTLHQILLGQSNQRKMKWAQHVTVMGEIINAHNMLVRKPKGNRPIGRPMHRWEDNIKMGTKERKEYGPYSGKVPVSSAH
jgi:hypothetical protein